MYAHKMQNFLTIVLFQHIFKFSIYKIKDLSWILNFCMNWNVRLFSLHILRIKAV